MCNEINRMGFDWNWFLNTDCISHPASGLDIIKAAFYFGVMIGLTYWMIKSMSGKAA